MSIPCVMIIRHIHNLHLVTNLIHSNPTNILCTNFISNGSMMFFPNNMLIIVLSKQILHLNINLIHNIYLNLSLNIPIFIHNLIQIPLNKIKQITITMYLTFIIILQIQHVSINTMHHIHQSIT